MFIKHLLKGACFALFASVTLAKEEYTGDCKEIEEYINKKQLNIDDIITKCVVNEEGKVTKLGINDRYLREWSVKRLLSYPTITELNYLYYCDKDLSENSEDILVDGDVNEYPPPEDPNAYKSYAWVMNARSQYCYKDIYPKIDKLVNLKKYELEINYIKAKGRIIDPTSNSNEEISSNIEEITLRYVGLINYDVSGFTNIKTLKIYNSSFENLQNIEKLTNLTTLILNDCVYDQEDIEKIKNLENIKELIIDGKNIIGNDQDDNGSTSDENPDNNNNNNESNDDGTDDNNESNDVNNESNNNDDESCDDEDENDDDDESCDEEDDEDDDDDESCDEEDEDDDDDESCESDDDDDNDSESDDDDDNDSESDDDEVEVDNDDGQSNNDDDDEDDSNDDSE